jgi:hypothetical protein
MVSPTTRTIMFLHPFSYGFLVPVAKPHIDSKGIEHESSAFARNALRCEALSDAFLPVRKEVAISSDRLSEVMAILHRHLIHKLLAKASKVHVTTAVPGIPRQPVHC